MSKLSKFYMNDKIIPTCQINFTVCSLFNEIWCDMELWYFIALLVVSPYIKGRQLHIIFISYLNIQSAARCRPGMLPNAPKSSQMGLPKGTLQQGHLRSLQGLKGGCASGTPLPTCSFVVDMRVLRM